MRRRKESQQDKINLSCLSLHLNPSLLKYLVFSPAITTTERQTKSSYNRTLPPLGPMPSTLPSSDSIIPGAHPDFDLEALRERSPHRRVVKSAIMATAHRAGGYLASRFRSPLTTVLSGLRNALQDVPLKFLRSEKWLSKAKLLPCPSFDTAQQFQSLM